jgi:hypothetical protein
MADGPINYAYGPPRDIRVDKEISPGYGHAALFHRIRLEKSPSAASQNAPHSVRNYDGYWGICGVSGVLALV